MAALAQSAVTKDEIYLEGGNTGRRRKVVRATLTLTGQGTATSIPVALFGMAAIHRAHSARLSDNTILVAVPSYDGLSLLLKAAGTNAAADYSGTMRVIVEGVE